MHIVTENQLIFEIPYSVIQIGILTDILICLLMVSSLST
jgi:hypothetical protein